MRKFQWVILMMAAVFTSACGFHLRGTGESAALPDALKTMIVQGIDLNQARGRVLTASLRANGVQLLSVQAKQSAAVLTVLSNVQERRVLSVGTNAKVSEYLLYGAIKFTVSDENGVSLTAPQMVEAQRDYQFDANQVVSAGEEQTALYDQINHQLVQALMRRLAALK